MGRNGTAENGFSLIEAVVALGLFSLCILAAIQMAAAVVNTNQTARDYTVALFLAQNKLEEVKACEFSQVASGEEKNLDAGGECGAGTFDRWVKVADQLTPRFKIVTVGVSWGSRIPRQVVLATIVAP
ncbi:MAG: prepilin-type N-terminal cleavage/methylation domain-containing protein [Pseudomonadota bacterium]